MIRKKTKIAGTMAPFFALGDSDELLLGFVDIFVVVVVTEEGGEEEGEEEDDDDEAVMSRERSSDLHATTIACATAVIGTAVSLTVDVGVGLNVERGRLRGMLSRRASVVVVIALVQPR